MAPALWYLLKKRRLSRDLLYEFSKGHEQLKLQGGALKNRIISKNDIEVLAKLPSQEILRAKAVMTLNSPIKQFVFVLNQTLTKFVYCLEQIKNRKGERNAE